jgi:hypothetical protein
MSERGLLCLKVPHASPASPDKSSKKTEINVEQWWNYADREKLKYSERNQLQ